MKTQLLNVMLGAMLLHGTWLKAQTFVNYTSANGLPADNVNGVAVDSQNVKWFGTQAGVARFDGSVWHTYTTADGLISDNITCIAVDKDDHIWAGTNDGVSTFDGTTWKSYTTFDGLINNMVSCIEGAVDGSVWFGTVGGVSRFAGNTWTSYTMTSGLPADMIGCLYSDVNGNRWIGTWLGGLSKFDGTGFSNFTVNDSLPDNSVVSLTGGKNKTLWVGTYYGVAVFDSTDQWMTTYRQADGLINDFILDIAMDSKGTMWFGIYDMYTQEGGISRLNNGISRSYRAADGLVNELVRSIAVDHDDHIWIATGMGVSMLDDPGSLVEENSVDRIMVSPNPVSGAFHFGPLPSEGTFTLFDALGSPVGNGNLQAGDNILSTGNLHPGLYFIQASYSGKTIAMKLLVRE